MSAAHAGPLSISPSVVFSALNAVEIGRHSIIAAYTILFYDWIISLDDEIALIYPASWNSVKIAYFFCRYFPLVVSPFHIWGLVTNHDRSTCHTYFRALYTCAMPTMLSAHFILMLRSYAFSGRKRLVLVVLSAFFLSLVGVVLWVMSAQLHLSNIFILTAHSGCFASTNARPVPSPHIGAYQLGLISVLVALFDCINMLMVIRHCIRERSTLGPLGQSFLKQGVLVYVIMTAMNALTIGTYFTPHLLMQGIGSWFAYNVPSALSCRLVLMLRRKACPTETELDDKYSNMINEAIEMIPAGSHPEDTIISSIRFERVDSLA